MATKDLTLSDVDRYKVFQAVRLLSNASETLDVVLGDLAPHTVNGMNLDIVNLILKWEIHVGGRVRLGSRELPDGDLWIDYLMVFDDDTDEYLTVYTTIPKEHIAYTLFHKRLP